VEGQIDREEIAQRPIADQGCNRLHPGGLAIGQVDGEQPVRPARSVDCGQRLAGVAAQRLLAEDRDAGVERANGLFSMERRRRRDHHAVEADREQRVQIVHDLDIRPEGQRLGDHVRRGIRDRDRLDRARREHRRHPVPPDPAGAQESKSLHHLTPSSRPWAEVPLHPPGRGSGTPGQARGDAVKSTQAFTKPSGLSRVASMAAPT
jgi:hypothetical protein